MDKIQAKENLSKLIDKFEKEKSAGLVQEYNEEATKTAFIQPFLKDVLGWNVSDRIVWYGAGLTPKFNKKGYRR